MFSALTIPNQYMHGYSYIPLQGNEPNAYLTENYEYIIDVAYNKLQIVSAEGVSFNGDLATKLTFSQNHKYKRGGVLRLYDSSGAYSGYITIISIPSNLSIIANFVLEQAITGSTYTSNAVSYSFLPSPVGDFKVDLSETTRNFLSQDEQFDSNDCFAGDNTRFNFDIHIGHKGKAVFNFYDNLSSSGDAGFISSGYTSVSDVPFQIGDEIIIHQDLYSWDYTDNYFAEGYLAFTGTSSNIFFTGDTVTITGQITQPYYNGPTTVVSAGTNYVVVNKTHTTSTPAEPGTIFGVVTPQYNTTAVIKDIYYSTAFTGVVIVTNIGHSENTPPIGGTIKHIDGRLIKNFDEYIATGFSSFNSVIDNEEYSMTDFNRFVIKNSAYKENNISTLLSNDLTKKYRIELETKSWLLFHNYSNNYANGVKYTWYGQSGNLLGTSYLPNISDNKLDFYAPVGINQVLSSSNRTDTGATLSSIVDDIFTYKVEGSFSGTQRTNAITFEVNDDCSMYEMYHILWKDKHGSWLSYPFKYIANLSEESDKKTYYKNSGNWNNGVFSFNTWDRGTTEFYSKNRSKIRINSGIVEQFENEIIKDLFYSSRRYIQMPNGDIYGCIITNNNLPLGDDFVEGVYNYTFDVQLTNNKIRL